MYSASAFAVARVAIAAVAAVLGSASLCQVAGGICATFKNGRHILPA